MAISPEDKKKIDALNCTQVGTVAGFKAASVAAVAIAVPTLTLVRVCPWAKANLNHTGQALIIGATAVAAFFINSEKAIMDGKRKNIGL